MIRSTFQLTAGVGPYRERQLWDNGVRTWDDLTPRGRSFSQTLDARLLEAVGRAERALGEGDAKALAAMMPARERFRLYPAFAGEAGFLDVETDGSGLVTAVSVLDEAGPRLFLRGRDLEAFAESTRGWKLLVTFNGASFDVPVLRRAFPDWRPPPVHLDLRQVWQRAGHRGGLKPLEEELGIGRPPHLADLRGPDAVRLWQQYLEGDRAALRLLAEYNLYDAVNLRPLMALGYNRLLERLRLPADPMAVAYRGDVLYDVTRLVLAV